MYSPFSDFTTISAGSIKSKICFLATSDVIKSGQSTAIKFGGTMSWF